MADLHVKVVGAGALQTQLQSAPEAIRVRLRKAVASLGSEVQRRTKEGYLHGPRPQHLGVLHGRLTRSINLRVTESETTIAAAVGTNLGYGAAWELGFDMKVGAGARGGPRMLVGHARERYFAKHPAGVRHMEPRPFLQPALMDTRPRIISELSRATSLAVAKGDGEKKGPGEG